MWIYTGKFNERYKGAWRVIIFKTGEGDTYGNYKSTYIYVNYNKYTIIIFDN